jgi:hypothetical protein
MRGGRGGAELTRGEPLRFEGKTLTASRVGSTGGYAAPFGGLRLLVSAVRNWAVNYEQLAI